MKINAWAAPKAKAELQPYTFEVEQPAPHECLVQVKACGICHSDIHMIDNDWQASSYPLVPGHEVVGQVVQIGKSVSHLQVGDHVGIGWQRSSCLHCPSCLQGNENLCEKNEALIVAGKGGFADHLLVDSRFAFRLPSGLDLRTTGPLLCGGITVFSALHHAGMTSGKKIGVIGIGGLGHMAVQFASRLGNHVTVYTTSHDKAEFAQRMGASEAIVATADGPLPAPRRKLDILLNTAPVSLDWLAYLEHLAPDGTLAFVAAPPEPLSIPVFPLLTRRLRIMGSPIGGRAMISRMLQLADDFGIVPLVEFFPLSEVNQALAKVRRNQVRYRAVLTVDDGR
jgi:uncharacterized zinc-type alcohol dehydrogenase-like protein